MMSTLFNTNLLHLKVSFCKKKLWKPSSHSSNFPGTRDFFCWKYQRPVISRETPWEGQRVINSHYLKGEDRGCVCVLSPRPLMGVSQDESIEDRTLVRVGYKPVFGDDLQGSLQDDLQEQLVCFVSAASQRFSIINRCKQCRESGRWLRTGSVCGVFRRVFYEARRRQMWRSILRLG